VEHRAAPQLREPRHVGQLVRHAGRQHERARPDLVAAAAERDDEAVVLGARVDRLCVAQGDGVDDRLPWRSKNAKRSVTDAEVVTLAVAQAVMDIPSDREFLKVARRTLHGLFPRLPAPSSSTRPRSPESISRRFWTCSAGSFSTMRVYSRAEIGL
jgi:hypothetical protein